MAVRHGGRLPVVFVLLGVAHYAAAEECVDTPGWDNSRGKTCDEYGRLYCTDGGFKQGHSWIGGEVFNWPERNCCACGKNPPAPPPAPKKPATYSVHHNLACKGADHQVKKVTVSTCQSHCAERKCACFHYGKGLCRFGFKFFGLTKSTSGFAAYVRTIEGVEIPQESLHPEQDAKEAARKANSCSPGAPSRVAPLFYMYEGDEFDWADRLVACYTSKNGRGPWQHEPGDRPARLPYFRPPTKTATTNCWTADTPPLPTAEHQTPSSSHAPFDQATAPSPSLAPLRLSTSRTPSGCTARWPTTSGGRARHRRRASSSSPLSALFPRSRPSRLAPTLSLVAPLSPPAKVALL